MKSFRQIQLDLFDGSANAPTHLIGSEILLADGRVRGSVTIPKVKGK